MKADTYREVVAMSIQQPNILIEHLEGNNYKQIWTDFRTSANNNVEKLLVELSDIRKALKIKSCTVEHDQAIGEIAAAEQLVKQGEGATAIKHLKNVGK